MKRKKFISQFLALLSNRLSFIVIGDIALSEVDGLTYAVRLIKTASNKNVSPIFEGPR